MQAKWYLFRKKDRNLMGEGYYDPNMEGDFYFIYTSRVFGKTSQHHEKEKQKYVLFDPRLESVHDARAVIIEHTKEVIGMRIRERYPLFKQLNALNNLLSTTETNEMRAFIQAQRTACDEIEARVNLITDQAVLIDWNLEKP